MNSKQEEFAREMLIVALEKIRFPSGKYGALRFYNLQNPDEIMLVLLDGKSDVALADCMVWGDGEGVCGSILLQFSRPEETVNFCYKNGRLNVMEVEGNA